MDENNNYRYEFDLDFDGEPDIIITVNKDFVKRWSVRAALWIVRKIKTAVLLRVR